MRKSHRSIRNLVAVGLFTALAWGCAGEPASPVDLVPGADSAGVLRLRNPDSSLYRSLQVQTWMGRYDIDAKGRFDARFPDIDDNRFAFVTHRDAPNDAVYYGYFFPARFDSTHLRPFIDRGAGLTIDARSTALSMVIINPLLFDSTVDQRAMVAEEAVQHPMFSTLSAVIEDHKSLNPTGAINYESTPDLYMLSSRITIDSLKAVAARLPDTIVEETVQPQGISYNYDMAYPSNKAGGGITIYNPKMAHYVAGFHPVGDTSWNPEVGGTSWFVVPGKERWLNVSIFPPKIETVPPTQTPVSLAYGASVLEIYKGFQFNQPFSTLWAIPPARMGMVANSWAAMNMMIALAGDITNIIFPDAGGVIQYITNNFTNPQSFEKVFNDVFARDRSKTIGSMYQLFVALLPSMENYIKQQAAIIYGDASGNSGTMTQISTLFNAVWALVGGGGIVNAIIDLTTQTIPFYYDLFTASNHAVYPIFDGAVAPHPNSPMISRVMPQTVFNGRNAIVYGFDLGANSGRVYVTGVTGVTYQVPVLVWTADTITFRIPDSELGIGSGEAREVFVQVEKSTGAQTNTLLAPFRYIAPGEGDGGGGCSALPNGRFEGAGLLMFALLVGVPAVYSRRRVCR